MKTWRVILRIGNIIFVTVLMYAFLRSPQFISQFQTKKSINILAWPNVIDPSYFETFENKTGIKIYLTYFEHYEELFIKLKQGASDYDLIMVGDYSVPLFIRNNMVKKIDKSRLAFWNDIYPFIKNLPYDPDNQYTIPYAWQAYGLGINTDYYNGIAPDPKWSLLFDPEKAPARVGMLDDAREIASVAMLYLYGKLEELPEDQLETITNLLIKQKKWVTAYTDMRSDRLLFSGAAPVVMGISSDIYLAQNKNESIQFAIPQEGSFGIIDNLMIPIKSQNDDMIYEFINFIFQKDVLSKYVNTFMLFPVTPYVELDHKILKDGSEDFFNRLHFFEHVFTDKQLHELWIKLKS